MCVSVYAGSLPDTDSHEMPRASNEEDTVSVFQLRVKRKVEFPTFDLDLK